MSKECQDKIKIYENKYTKNLTLSDRIFLQISSILLFLVIIFPNSMRSLTFALMLGALTLALTSSPYSVLTVKVFLIWLASACITTVFILVGYSNSFSGSVQQNIFIYIVSPLIWMVIFTRLTIVYPSTLLAQKLLALGILGALSVFAFYYIFFSFGPDYLTWLISDPNVDFRDGVTRATMHVFGSLLFIIAGFFAAPSLIDNKIYRLIFSIVLLLATFLSGRSALILAIAIGLGFLFINSIRKNIGKNNSRFTKGLSFTFLLVIIFISIANHLGVDVLEMLTELRLKISEGGGVERVEQADSLIEGINNSWWLGAGHGVGVEVIRNEEFPWRYELLWLATIFRVGIIGATIYCIPIYLIIKKYLIKFKRNENNLVDDFIFSGFLASFIGSATNPYYESFEFQWMITLPFIYFYQPHIKRKWELFKNKST